jgi:hypothetical protein
MKDKQSLSDELLKQDGLARNEATEPLVEMMRRIQAKAEQRERFWFRMACGFWLVAGICFLLVAFLGGVEAHSSARSAVGGDAPADAVKNAAPVIPAEPQIDFHPVRTTFFGALLTLPVAVLGGIFSAVWLMFTRRQAGQAAMQATLVALTKEIRELKAQRGEEPE